MCCFIKGNVNRLLHVHGWRAYYNISVVILKIFSRARVWYALCLLDHFSLLSLSLSYSSFFSFSLSLPVSLLIMRNFWCGSYGQKSWGRVLLTLQPCVAGFFRALSMYCKYTDSRPHADLNESWLLIYVDFS